MRPKVASDLLRTLAHGKELDFVVLFSSTTSILGSGNLGHYAGANQFLDTLAFTLRSYGIPAISISWGTWQLMGDHSGQMQREYSRTGLNGMAAKQALSAMGALIRAGDTQSVVADVNWEMLRGVYEAKRARPMLEFLTTRSQEHSRGRNRCPNA